MMYGILGVISIVIGFLAILTVASDIQIILVAVCLLGGFILIGIHALLKRLDKLMPLIVTQSDVVATENK